MSTRAVAAAALVEWVAAQHRINQTLPEAVVMVLLLASLALP
jgi:hypothetical protein